MSKWQLKIADMAAKQISLRRAQVTFERWMVVLVILMAGAMALFFYSDAVYRAKMIEPITLLGGQRTAFAETFALTGEVPQGVLQVQAANAPNVTKGRRIASVRDLVETQQSIAQTDLMLIEVEGFGTRRVAGSTTTNAIIGISDGVLTAAVYVPFLKRPSLVEFRPAMAALDAPVVIWLCGQQQPPDGMVAPAVREPAVPDKFLPSACRGRV